MSSLKFRCPQFTLDITCLIFFYFFLLKCQGVLFLEGLHGDKED